MIISILERFAEAVLIDSEEPDAEYVDGNTRKVKSYDCYEDILPGTDFLMGCTLSCCLFEITIKLAGTELILVYYKIIKINTQSKGLSDSFKYSKACLKFLLLELPEVTLIKGQIRTIPFDLDNLGQQGLSEARLQRYYEEVMGTYELKDEQGVVWWALDRTDVLALV